MTSIDRSSTAHAISSYDGLARTVVKFPESLDDLSPKERIRFHFWKVVVLRRFEEIYAQGTYGFIDQKTIERFEKSILILISSSGPAKWWNSSRTAFSSDFVKYDDGRLSTDSFQKLIHPGMNND